MDNKLVIKEYNKLISKATDIVYEWFKIKKLYGVDGLSLDKINLDENNIFFRIKDLNKNEWLNNYFYIPIIVFDMDNNAREIFLKNLIYGENKNAK